METTSELKAMDGKPASEKLVYNPSDNTMYDPKQWEAELATLEASHPKIAAKLRKAAVPFLHTWIWKFDYSRQGNPGVYQTEEKWEMDE